jgi:hypothetical protein
LLAVFVGLSRIATTFGTIGCLGWMMLRQPTAVAWGGYLGAAQATLEAR